MLSPESPSSASPASVLDAWTVNLLLAPELVGNSLGWFLYGILTLQTYNYYLTFGWGDRKIILFTVYGVFVLETLLSVISAWLSFSLLCSGWGDPSALTKLTWVDAFVPLLCGLVSIWIQTFYAWRVYSLRSISRMWAIVAIGLIIPLSLLSTSMAIFSTVVVLTTPSIEGQINTRSELFVWLTSNILCDFIIASSMIIVLQNSRRRVRILAPHQPEVTSATRRVGQIIMWSVETCILTTAAIVLTLVFFLAEPQSRLLIMMGFITSRLYSISLQTTLLTRQSAGDRQSDKQSFTRAAPHSAIQFKTIPPSSSNRRTGLAAQTDPDVSSSSFQGEESPRLEHNSKVNCHTSVIGA